MSEIESQKYFKPLHFTEVSAKYSLNAYYADFLRKEGGLSQQLFRAKLADANKMLSQMGANPNMWNDDPSGSVISERIQKIREKVAQNKRKEVDDFFVAVFNQTLVMMVTVFEAFLVDCMSVIAESDPLILMKMAKDEDITISDVNEFSDKNSIFYGIRQKVIDRFDFAGLDKKIGMLQKIGLTTSDLFSLNEEYSLRYPNSQSFLRKIYEDRNDIVHRDAAPIQKYEELGNIANFIDHLILKWGAITFRNKFTIDSDVQVLLNSQKSV